MGSGGVGGVFGARLWRAGNEVTFIARGAHLEAMKEHGLQVLSDQRGDVKVLPISATANPADVEPVDYVLFCVKLWDTETAARSIKPMLHEETVVISLQNGIERDDTLKEILGEHHIVGGVSYIGATITAPGVIQQRGTVQRIVYGEYSNQRTKRILQFQEACRAAEIEAIISDDIEKSIWEKFTLLVGMSALCAATRQTIGPVRSNARTRRALQDVIEEALAVGRRKGIALDADLAERHMQYLDGLAPDVTASMQHDLVHGNRLELPWLSSAVVRLGESLSVDTPVNRTLSAILSPYEMGAAAQSNKCRAG